MNCSSDKLLENSFLHQKSRSPPTKPPRRRFSEHLVSGEPSFDELKHANGFHLRSIDARKNASLPTNWTADFGHLEAEEGLCSRSAIPCSSSRYQQKSSFDVFSLQNQSEKNVVKVEKCETTNDSFGDTNESPVFTKYKEGKLEFYKTVLKNCSENVEKKKYISPVQKSKNVVPNFKPLHSKSHRRHHSDPLFPCFIQNSRNDSDSFDWSDSQMNIMKPQVNETKEHSNVCLACKEIECLQEETRKLKEINDKLWQNLLSVESSLENLQSMSSDASSETPFTEFLSEFYYAQKAKECAMEERLKVVIEDRNSALLEMENMLEAVVDLQFGDLIENGSLENSMQSTGKCSDKKLQEVLQEIEMAENPITLIQKRNMLMSHMYRSKDARNGVLSHELELVHNEKDALSNKVKSLETELKDLKQSSDVMHMDHKHWEDSLLEMLCYVIQQRNFVLSKLENARNTDHIFRSFRPSKLQKMFSKQPYFRLDHESCVKSDTLVEKDNMSSHSKLDLCVQPYDIFVKDPIALKDEVTSLNIALDLEKQKNERLEAECQRLERLVHVLQKKVGGKNLGVFV